MAQLLASPPLMKQAGVQQQPQQQAGGSQIPYWGYYAGAQGGGAYLDYDPTNTDMGKQFLDAVHKYDPSAGFRVQESSDGQKQYIFQGDNSKLPWESAGKTNYADMNHGAYNPQYYGDPNASRGYTASEMQTYANQHPRDFDYSQLYDPNAITNDPVLGRVTDRRNIKPQGATLLDILGPLAVGGFGMLAGGGGALASVLQKAPRAIESVVNGNFNPYQLASYAIPFIPGINNIPFLASGARMGLNYLGSQRRGG